MIGVHTRFDAREKLPKRNGEIGLSERIGNDESTNCGEIRRPYASR